MKRPRSALVPFLCCTLVLLCSSTGPSFSAPGTAHGTSAASASVPLKTGQSSSCAAAARAVPARAAAAPVDDIRGLRLGTRVEDVARYVKCQDPRLATQLQIKTGGVPGRQVLIGMRRREVFPPGKQPSPEVVIASLKQKYGPPVDVHPFNHDIMGYMGTQLVWAYSREGEPLKSLKDCPFNRQQWDGISIQDIDSGHPECVNLIIRAEFPNTQMVAWLDVAVENEAIAEDAQKAYDAWAAKGQKSKPSL
jgi:hypothetical protein